MNRLRERYNGTVDFMVYEKVDLDAKAGAFADEHGVRAVPTMMIVGPSGRELERVVGGQSEDALARRLDQAVGASAARP